jgi:hypothetical protein
MIIEFCWAFLWCTFLSWACWQTLSEEEEEDF